MHDRNDHGPDDQSDEGGCGGVDQPGQQSADALGGDDVVTVGETVQRTVWVDAGKGNDKVTIAPSLAFLPDATDPAPTLRADGTVLNNRKDSKGRAY